MGNIIYFCGIQLAITILVIHHNGDCYILSLIFGPFRTHQDIEDWKEVFLNELLKNCLKIPGVENCTKRSESVKTYNAKDISVLRPDDPREMAEDVISLYFESEDNLNDGGFLANRYYDWVATLRFDFLKESLSYEVERNFGPLNDFVTFRAWWKKFKKGVRDKASDLGNIRFRVLKGEFIEVQEYLEREGEDDFFEIVCWDPVMKGQEFLTEVLKKWLKKNNSFG